jgi:hypothetical protein
VFEVVDVLLLKIGLEDMVGDLLEILVDILAALLMAVEVLLVLKRLVVKYVRKRWMLLMVI